MIYSTSCLLIATGPRVRVLDLFLPDLRPPEGLRRQTSRETLDALTCSIHVQGRSGDSDRQVEWCWMYLEIHLDSFSQVGLMIDALDLERNSSKRWRHREVRPGAEPNKAWAVTSWDLRWPWFLHSKCVELSLLVKIGCQLAMRSENFPWTILHYISYHLIACSFPRYQAKNCTGGTAPMSQPGMGSLDGSVLQMNYSCQSFAVFRKKLTNLYI